MCIWLVKNQDKKKPEVILLCWQVAVNRFTHASICLGLEKKAHTLITKPSKICNCLYWVIFHTNNVRCTIMSALFVIRMYLQWVDFHHDDAGNVFSGHWLCSNLPRKFYLCDFKWAHFDVEIDQSSAYIFRFFGQIKWKSDTIGRGMGVSKGKSNRPPGIWIIVTSYSVLLQNALPVSAAGMFVGGNTIGTGNFSHQSPIST